MLAALAALVAVAFAVEATVGFGSTVLVVTVGAQWLPLEELLAAFVPVSLVLSAVLLGRARRVVRHHDASAGRCSRRSSRAFAARPTTAASA